MDEKNVGALDDLNGRFLTFYIGDSVYGISLFHVLEIIKIQPITKVPNVPGHIKGIINLRGKIVPVIDVRLKFSQMEIEHTEKTCIIVVEMDEMQIGLIVDSVSEVATIEPDQLASPPEIGGSYTNKFLQSVAKVGERVILNIDIVKFFHEDLIATMY